MSVDNDTLVRDFMNVFERKDADLLVPFLHPRIVFRNYGDAELVGSTAVVEMWRGVFANFDKVRFETLNQAVNGEVVIAEQIHGLGLPGRPVAPIVNMAVYEIRDGLIAAWRDYTNPVFAARLLQG
jgi:limonene-1,2-epoxide hydrolase